MNKTCKSCNQALSENAKFCSNCGAAVSEQSIICKNCKTENPAQSKYCKNCGSALSKKVKTANQKKLPSTGKTFYQNPYFIIMGLALLAMIVATYYNYRLMNSGNQNPPAQNVSQNQNNAETFEHTHTLPDPAMIEEITKKLKQDPDNVQLNVQMGNMLFDSQKFKEAMPYYQKALQFEPNNPDVIVDLGVCYFNLDNFAKAKELFQQALEINPNHVNALYNVGVVAVRLKEMNLLMDAWSKLVKVAPSSPQAEQASQILDEIHSSVQQDQN
jgi:cytochrome c-type biogenesis protein CcmH/NrfG